MSGGLGYLTAVYRDGRVYIGSKSYAGRHLCGTSAEPVLQE